MSWPWDSKSVTGWLTGGLIDPVTPDFAGAATGAEKSRENQIKRGMDYINAVFSGGTVPSYTAATDPSAAKLGGKFNAKGKATYNKGAQYYRFSGGNYVPWNVKRPGQGSNVLGDTAKGAAIGSVFPLIGTGLGAAGGALFGGLFDNNKPVSYANEFQVNNARNKLYLKGADQTFAGFQPSFFDNAAQNYMDFALPQLGKQYTDASNSIQYGLANRGLVGSGAERKAQSDLALTTGQAEQGIVDTAKSTANTLRQQIENARNQAISQLYQTADPSQAQQSAISSASQFSIPQTFTPVANLFSGLANQYAINSYLGGGYTAPNTIYPWQTASASSAGALGPVTQ